MIDRLPKEWLNVQSEHVQWMVPESSGYILSRAILVNRFTGKLYVHKKSHVHPLLPKGEPNEYVIIHHLGSKYGLSLVHKYTTFTPVYVEPDKLTYHNLVVLLNKKEEDSLTA